MRAIWRIVRLPFWLGLGVAIGFLVPYVLYLDREVRSRFDDLSWQFPSRVYARPLELAPGLPMNAQAPGVELDAARYTEDAAARAPGTFHRDGDRYTISRREFIYLDGRERAKRIALTLDKGRVAALADGGEGTVAAVAAARPDGVLHRVDGLRGPDGRQVSASWLELDPGTPDSTAVIEMASVSGLPLMDRLDPLGATTYGLGQLINAALDSGCRTVIIGAGGSATTDGGAGALAALGLHLLDDHGRVRPHLAYQGDHELLLVFAALDLAVERELVALGVTLEDAPGAAFHGGDVHLVVRVAGGRPPLFDVEALGLREPHAAERVGHELGDDQPRGGVGHLKRDLDHGLSPVFV